LYRSTSDEGEPAREAHPERSEHYRRIGKKGGETLKQERGSAYYRCIAQRGGKACMEKHGRDHFMTIGKRGGKTTSERHGPEFYSRIGKLGAEARRRKRENRDMTSHNTPFSHQD
jgi:general stress protein YciG